MILIGLHVAGLVLDSYTHFGISAALVPFAATWHPVAVVGMLSFVRLDQASQTADEPPRPSHRPPSAPPPPPPRWAERPQGSGRSGF